MIVINIKFINVSNFFNIKTLNSSYIFRREFYKYIKNKQIVRNYFYNSIINKFFTHKNTC